MNRFTKTWALDALERVCWTFAQAFLTLFAAGLSNVSDFSTLKTLAISAAVGAVAAVKTVVAGFIGDPNTASLK